MVIPALLLVCLAAIPRADCSPNTAVRALPGPVVELRDCRRWAPRWEAEPEVEALVGAGRYLKVVCGGRVEVVG